MRLDTLRPAVLALTATAVLFATSISPALAAKVGYYTDYNTGTTAPSTPITAAGDIPIHIGNISTFDLTTIDILMVNESNNGPLSGDLTGRLGAIDTWVQSGGKFVVHDRYVGPDGVPFANPFLVGGGGILTVRDYWTNGADLDVIAPNDTLVTNGPHGTINNSTLDGGNFSSHGYAQGGTLPGSAKKILSQGSDADKVAAFSYGHGSGFVYYSTIPLDFYLGGGNNFADPYAPNVLEYVDGLGGNAPAATPEPCSMALLGAGVLGLAGKLRRRRNNDEA